MFVEKSNDLGFIYLFINKHLLSTTLDAGDTKRNHNHKILTDKRGRKTKTILYDKCYDMDETDF